MSKRILLLYGKNSSEIFNRKSAIGSYLNSLSKLLESDTNYKVFINGKDFHTNTIIEPTIEENSISFPKKVFSFLKKIIPNKLKSILRERQILKSAKSAKELLLSNNETYDYSIELLTIGSDLTYSLSAKITEKKIIIYDAPLLEEYEFFYKSRPFYKSLIEKKIKQSLVSSDFVVVYSDAMKKHVLSYGIDEAKIRIHQNIDFSRFDIEKIKRETITGIKLCFIGSFLAWHRVDILIKAFENVVKMCPNQKLELFLVGDGMLKKEIEDQVNKSSSKNNIVFTGFLDGKELYELKKQMNIGIMPSSNWYGAPNKIFEYGGMHLACIAPHTPTIDYIFDNDEIIQFPNNSEEGLTSAIFEYCSNPDLIEVYADKLYTKISNEYGEKVTKDFYLGLINA
ncbi:glycosyltransferase family 4 protein [Paracrocinitomix mangrovi]|uniref:glycosyltransferase family 4 protein n=1 Tax=Paracrocinitomix mangrovi TaxID=2862509 RepID=UPI001C8D14CB|nr:glycosyltransferase family 4 protein [Paracrocinitomix mangrovi]UKN01570.1 glycosyltransferase family 4 protein [Paracrocinitomix mangrovi]